MRDIRIQDIVEAVRGRLLCGDPAMEIRNIAIDSRTMQGADIFVPIIGAKVDAHRFINGAFAAGAAATFTSEHDAMEDPDHAWIRVEDTVQALQALGRYYRDRVKIPVIGVTGSVGKTTTREMIAAALASEKKVTTTAGNSNGQLGVPITICSLDLDADIAILEMGMSEPGEMPRIAAIARPDLGVVTNIGISHIENLGSRENICAEKMHIADHFGPENRMILNGDDDLLPSYRGNDRFGVTYYGQAPDCDYRAENIRIENGHTYFTAIRRAGVPESAEDNRRAGVPESAEDNRRAGVLEYAEVIQRAGAPECARRDEVSEGAAEKRMEITLAIPGAHNVMNALAALAVCDACGVSWEGAAGALAEFRGFSRRLQMVTVGEYTYVDDTYNASPDSMKAALQVLAMTPTEGRRIAVLADMLELGPDSPRFHYETGVYGTTQAIDRVYIVGELAKNIGRAYEEKGISVEYCESNQDAVKRIREFRRPGDLTLLKGSNGMHLGEVLKGLSE